MKIKSKTKANISTLAQYVHDSIAWAWIQDTKYKVGGYESTYHAICRFVYSNTKDGVNLTIRDVEIALKLNTVKHVPKVSAIERRIVRLMKKI